MSDQPPARSGTVALRLATRLARREVRRRPGRTLLVALLVAMPVAGMVVADVALRTNSETPLQIWRNRYGSADAVVFPGPTVEGDKNGSATAVEDHRIAALIAKSRVVVGRAFVESSLFRTVDAHRSYVDIWTMPMRDPITRGSVQIMAGRAPKGGNEVFLTSAAAKSLHVAAGDTLRLERPSRSTFTVTGTGEFADGWGVEALVLPPGARVPWKASGSPEAAPLLLDLPASVRPAELQSLFTASNAASSTLEVSPALVTPPPWLSQPSAKTDTSIRWSWVIGALVLTVAGIVIAAAFAVGARRQLVTLGQLAANGASPRLLRQVLFLQGTWTGLAGAFFGFGIGAGALAALAPYADRIVRKDVHPYTVHASDLVPIFVLGVLTATIAALLPARTTSRLPVLAALAGRRPLGKVPRWLPITGACVATGGLALFGLAVIGASRHTNGPRDSQVWALTAIVGGVAVLLGACAIAPAYVSILEPAATRTRGAARIAVRSLARQRTRTGAVVSAIAATGALAIAASSLVLAADKQNRDQQPYMRSDEVQLSGFPLNETYLAPPDAVVATVQKALKGSTRWQVVGASRPDMSWQLRDVVPDHPSRFTNRDSAQYGSLPVGLVPGIAVADRTIMDRYGLSTRARNELARRGALYLGPDDGHVVVESIAPSTDALGQPVAPATTVPPTKTAGAGTTVPPARTFAAAMSGERVLTGSLPRLLVTAAEATKLGLKARPSTVVLRTPKALTKDQRNLLQDLFFDVRNADKPITPSGTSSGIDRKYVNFDFFTPSNRVDPLLIEWALVGIALVLVLFVVAVNLALSASETRDERDVLTIVGAAPSAMRRANGYKAVLLTVMGTLLAIPVGFLPVTVFVANSSKHLPLVFPWRVVTLLVVALSLVAGLVTMLASGIALRLRPVRISTMAFD